MARTVHAQVLPRVDHRLTAKGETLRPIILAMKDRGERFAPGTREGRSSAA